MFLPNVIFPLAVPGFTIRDFQRPFLVSLSSRRGSSFFGQSGVSRPTPDWGLNRIAWKRRDFVSLRRGCPERCPVFCLCALYCWIALLD